MAPGLLATSPSPSLLFHCYSSTTSPSDIMSTSALSIPRSQSATPTGKSSSSSSFIPTFSKDKSNGSGNSPNGSGSGSTSLAVAYFTQRRLHRQASNPMLRISPTLPDISESPTTPTAKRSMISNVTSGGSGGLLPITEKDQKERPLSLVSNWSDVSNISASRLPRFRGASSNTDDLDGSESVFDGSIFDGEEEEDMWKAEKALAGIKTRLNAFESSIHKARNSLITSPKSPNSVSTITSPTSISTISTISTTKSHPRPNLRPFPVIPTNPRTRQPNSHFRNASESHVQSDAHVRPMEIPRSESVAEVRSPERRDSITSNGSRQDSAQQMRALHDQMKDLRGKISVLQERTRYDSLRRRSHNSLRATTTPLNNIFQPPVASHAGHHTSSSVSSFYSTTEGIDREDGSDGESTCETPRPFPALRKSMSYEELGYDSAFSAPGDELTQIVSFPRRNRGKGSRSDSSSGSSENSNNTSATALPIPTTQSTVAPLIRTESFNSISSYETALEDDFESPYTSPLESKHQRSPSKASIQVQTVIHEVPNEEEEYEILHLKGDGYHSSESSTSPRVEISQENSDIVLLTPNRQNIMVPLTERALSDMQQRLSVSPSIAARSATNSILGVENDELALKLPPEDRSLVETLCEQLGTVCCRMELEVDPMQRIQIRRKLELALAMLQGDSLI